MKVTQLNIDANGTIKVAGALTFATVNQLWQQSKALLSPKTAALRFDLQDVSQSDSAGVALLIAWMRAAQQQKKSIHFTQAPQQMRAIVRVSSLEKILPIEN